MALYDIYFAGEIVNGADLAKVKPQIGKLFKANPAQLEKLFCGKPVRIKGGVDDETAAKYRAALRKIGAVVEIREKKGEEKRPAPPPAAAPAAIPEAPRPPPETASARSTDQLEAVQDYGMLEELPENRGHSVAAPRDIPELDVLPPRTGSLEEFAEEETPVPLPDVAGIPLASTGELLDQTPPPPDAQIDTGELSAAPPNSGSLEDCAVEETPVAIPDISRLKVTD